MIREGKLFLISVMKHPSLLFFMDFIDASLPFKKYNLKNGHTEF